MTDRREDPETSTHTHSYSPRFVEVVTFTVVTGWRKKKKYRDLQDRVAFREA